MEKNDKSKTDTICKSVFKSGESTTSKNQFTKMWIELINKIEKNKAVSLRK